MQFYSSSMNAPRDPGTAATLSLVPGLGQFYNGQSRKAILFFDVALINAALLCLMTFAGPATRALSELGQTTHMKLNSGLLVSLQQLQLGTPGSLVILGLFLAFVGFSVRDAYDNAAKKRRKAIYGDSVIDLTEATSGSYIFHISLMFSLAIMALFFCIPKPAPRQFTEIEFLAQQIKKPEQLKKPVNARDVKSTQDHGQVVEHSTSTSTKRPLPAQEKVSQPNRADKMTPNKAQTKPSSSASSAAAPSQPKPAAAQPQPKQVQAAKPTAVAPPLPQLSSIAPPKPMLMPKSSAAAPSNPLPAALPKLALNVPANPLTMPSMNLKAAVPTTVATHSTPSSALQTIAPVSILSPSTTAAAMPLPAAAMRASSTSGFPGMPSVHTGPIAGVNTAGGPSPSSFISGSRGTDRGFHQSVGGPVSATSSPPGSVGGTGNGPSPKVIAVRPGTSGVGGPGSQGTAVSPSRATGSGTHSGPAIVPTTGGGGPLAADDPSDGGGVVSPRKNTDGRENAREAQGTPDFTAYMQDLQRRIKRAWFPARTDLSNRVVVLFKIHSDGSVSNISLRKSSGISRHDNAALTAVQNAAPFPPLPKYSPDAVDIEFTFDYNVFSGGR